MSKLLSDSQAERCLIIYGNLSPGKPNHYKMRHMTGIWVKGIVLGKLENEGWAAQIGFPGFKLTGLDEQTEISVDVFFSSDLKDNWAYLDNFEGEGYQRILVEYKLESGELGIGNIYALS